jgi:hypothetical protein
MTHERALYRRWIIANGWAEAVGLGTTFVIGTSLAPWLNGMSGVRWIVAGAVAAILLGILLEGVVVGVAQETVLRSHILKLPRGAWTIATAVGAGLAWSLGMLPSTVMALTQAPSDAPVPEPGPAVQYLLACALGAVTGPVLAAAQWTVLRRHVRRATRWLLANSVAWAVGMLLVFLGMEYVPWGAHVALVSTAIYAVCGTSGLAVGAVHGWVLVRLVHGGATPGPEAEIG